MSAGLRAEADAVRRLVLEQALASGSCHIGSSLSLVDILTVLYFRTLRAEAGDRFLLSKGHAAAALYAVLARTGTLDERAVVAGYCRDGGSLDRPPRAAHPRRRGDGRLARPRRRGRPGVCARRPWRRVATAAPTAWSATAS